MIDRDHALRITKQAELVGIARSTVYYLPRPVSADDLALMREIDALHTEFPFAAVCRSMTSLICSLMLAVSERS